MKKFPFFCKPYTDLCPFTGCFYVFYGNFSLIISPLQALWALQPQWCKLVSEKC